MVVWWLAGCRAESPAEGPPPPPPEVHEVGALVFDGPLPRNLLMISIDTLRRDRIDRWATDGVPRADFLTARFAEGVALDDHQQCANWTFHSMSCTLLGRPVEEIGWVAKLNGDGPTPFPSDQPMLAVRLRDAGFRTLLASATGWLSEEWNNAQGYEPDLAATADALGVAEAGIEGLVAAQAEDPDARWFLHLHVVEPHAAYSPPEGYRDEIDALPPIPFDLDDHDVHYDVTAEWPDMTPEQQELLLLHLQTRYTAEIRWLDDQLATIWGELDERGLLDDTLVAIWNDHGEAFWERGQQTHAYYVNAEENDAFLGFWAKNLRPAAWSGPTSAIDLAPTALAALGLEVPTDGTLPGYVVGTAPADRPRFASTSARVGTIAAVTVDGKKLTFGFDGDLHLYDRAADPAELVDLWTPGDPVAEELWTELLPRVELLAAAAPEVPLTLPE